MMSRTVVILHAALGGRAMKMRLATALALVSLFLFPINSPSALAAENAQYHIKLAEITFASSIMGQAVQRSADLIADKSGRRIAVTVYPASQLGDESQLLQTALSPTFRDVNMLSEPILSTIDPRFSVTLLPFLFRDAATVGAFSGSDAFAVERDLLLKTRGMRMLAAWDFPPENLFVKRPITSLADLKDVKIRVPPSADVVKIFKQLGANPTPVAQTQTYLAIQTGVVDGSIGSDDGALAYKYTDVTKYDINVHYQIVFDNPVISERFYQSLPRDLQTVLVDAARETAAWNHQQVVRTEESMKSQMEQAGIKVLEVNDIEAWKTAVQPLSDAFVKQYGDDEFTKIRNLP